MEKLKNDFKISFTKGDTYAIAVKFKNITEDLSLACFTVKENPDDSPLIQKTLGAGIDKIDDRAYKTEKTYKVQLQAIDTINLEANVQYLYDLQITLGNVVKTVLSGIFVVNHSISGISAVTTQELDVAVDDEIETEVLTTPATKGIEYEQDPVACAKIGDLTKLETTNKDTVVKAVNEIKNNIPLIALWTMEVGADITNIKVGYKNSFKVSNFNRKPVVNDLFCGVGKSLIDGSVFGYTAEIKSFTEDGVSAEFEIKEVVVLYTNNIKNDENGILKNGDLIIFQTKPLNSNEFTLNQGASVNIPLEIDCTQDVKIKFNIAFEVGSYSDGAFKEYSKDLIYETIIRNQVMCETELISYYRKFTSDEGTTVNEICFATFTISCENNIMSIYGLNIYTNGSNGVDQSRSAKISNVYQIID